MTRVDAQPFGVPVAEAARLLGVSKATLHRAINEGRAEVKTYKVRDTIRVTVASIEEVIANAS